MLKSREERRRNRNAPKQREETEKQECSKAERSDGETGMLKSREV